MDRMKEEEIFELEERRGDLWSGEERRSLIRKKEEIVELEETGEDLWSGEDQ